MEKYGSKIENEYSFDEKIFIIWVKQEVKCLIIREKLQNSNSKIIKMLQSKNK